MNLMWPCLILYAISAATASTVQTNYGPIEGKTVTLFDGQKVDAYLGVPYAAPPVDSRRFTSPRPPTPWNKPLKTVAFSKPCFQAAPDEMKKVAWFLPEGPESEDCLYLNVWKPYGWEDKMRVMVWFHPGAFFCGSASMPLYDGAILAAQKKIVVVSMNYRLSVFGNLYLGSTVVPGNFGLQDQIQAIKWVNENIKHFGGDPNRVTLFGECAGSMSIGFHLRNPDVSNLFQNGILLSGSPNMDDLTLTKEVALKYSLTLGKSVDCPIDDMRNLANCLRRKPAWELIKNYKELPAYGKYPFNPVRNGKEVPLNPQDISNLPLKGRKNLIMGNVPVAANAFIPMVFPGELPTDGLTISLAEIRALIKNYLQLNDETLQDVILHEYTNFSLPLNINQYRDIGLDFFSDTMLTCACSDFAKAYRSNTNSVYYYWFDYKPSRPMKGYTPKWVVAMHGDEIPFVFGAPLNPLNNYTGKEQYLSGGLMNFMVTFANLGNPNGEDSNVWPVQRPHSELTCLQISRQLTITTVRFPKERECAFWRGIYPELLRLQDKCEPEM